MAGYHLRDIPKSEYGTFEKIEEEFEEAKDALEQNCSVMLFVEFADLIGAIEGFLEKNYPNITLNDLIKMKNMKLVARNLPMYVEQQ